MYGKYQIDYTSDSFLDGLTTSDYTEDGGYSPLSTCLNPYQTPGIIYGSPDYTERLSNVSGNMIASCEDSQTVSANARISIDASGNIYSIDSNPPNANKRITGLSKTYAPGITDMVSFSGNTYASSSTHLTQINTSAWTANETYQAFSNQEYHPLIVYEGMLFAGDGNLLKTLTSGGTWATQMTLATSERIVTLGIDPSSGLLLISTQASYNPTGTLQQRGIIYMHDGYSAKPRRKITCDDNITAFYTVDSTVFVGQSQTLGQWNGSGVTFLRKLKNVTQTQNSLLYRHKFAHVGNLLFVLDGQKILSYGEIQKGKKVFNYYGIASSAATSPYIYTLMPLGQNLLGVAYPSNGFAYYDLTDSTTAGAFGQVYFPWRDFGRPTYIRKIRIYTTGVTATGAYGVKMAVSFNDDTATERKAQNYQVSVSSGTQYIFDFDYNNIKTMSIQPKITWGGPRTGIYRVVVFYDPAE